MPVHTLRLSLPFVAAFIALRHIFHELHEFGHMVAGRLLCGAWGSRDFNNVHAVVAQCSLSTEGNVIAAFAGPVVNYVTVWTGALIVRRAQSAAAKAWGLSLIFASLPFARLFTALVGGGDEMGIARLYVSDPTIARLVCIAAVAALLAWPLYVAFDAMANTRRRLAYFAGFLLLPMLLEGAVVLLFFNYLLKLGVLADTWAFGAPGLVLLVLMLACVALLALARQVKALVYLSDPQAKVQA